MMGSPELPQDNHDDLNVAAANHVTIDAMDETSGGSDDSDNEGNDYSGYQPLAGDDDGHTTATIDTIDDDDDIFNVQQPTQPSEHPPPEIANRITQLESNVWNAPRPETSTIELDSTRTAQILSAMSQISIPTEFTPDWAKEVSEEKWKEELLQRIRSRQSNGDESISDGHGADAVN